MALNTDLVRLAAPNYATTLANTMLISDTSLTLQSATGLPTATAITLVIDATDPVSGVATPTLKEVVTGTLSGSTVSNLLRGLDGTTAQGHASGANVVMWITANLWNDFQTSYLTQHNQLGTHSAITGTSINLTGNSVIGGTLAVTGASTLSGAVGGAGYSVATISNPYKFSVYRNANGTSTTSTATLVYDTKTFDTGTNYSVSTGKFTVPVAGFYFFQAAAQTSSVSNFASNISLLKNGTTTVAIMGGVQIGGSQANQTQQISQLVQLAANDTIEVQIINTVGTLTINSGLQNTFFTGFLVSAT